MHVAFYAPMKPPDHPVPSGDRRMARALIAALRRAGHKVSLASRLRSWDAGTPARQQRIRRQGERTAQRLIDRWHAKDAPGRPDLWFTYHLYHKAPDWLGPPVCQALDIPYVAAEASYAGKQADGPWAEGLEASRLALNDASAVFALSETDFGGLVPHVAPGRLHRLTPFIDTRPFARKSRPGPAAAPPLLDRLDPPVLLAIGMMRTGDKLASYQVLGRALSLIADRPWTLAVLGDGPARTDVRAALPEGRTAYLGALPEARVPAVIQGADLLVWPAINEAYGMALLEAQAGGLPVIAGASGGVPEIVRDGITGLLTPPGDAAAFAAAVAALIDDHARRVAMAKAASRNAMENHDISSAAAAIERVIGTLS